MAVERRNDIADQIQTLEATETGEEYAVFTAIQLLERYYADPMYLTRVEGGIEDVVTEVRTAFETMMVRGFGPLQSEIGADSDSARIAFSNYTNLCRYYAENGGVGLNLSEAEAGADSVQNLLGHRADVLAEYARRTEQPGDALSQSNLTGIGDAAINQESASDYLNGETGKLLVAAMQALEGVPQFPTVGQLWPGTTDVAPKEPNVSEFLSQLNQKYRSTNGQLSLQERAFTKLRSQNSTTARFCAVMAGALDGMIIALCCLRGREYYANNVRNRRQLTAMLFVVPFTDGEKEQNEQGRLRVLAGTVLGSFAYVLYFRLLPGSGGNTAIAAFILIVCGIMLMALLGALWDIFQPKSPDQDTKSDEEKLPIRERLTPLAYNFFKEDVKCGYFCKQCSVRRPKTSVVRTGADYYLEEKRIWKRKEDHRIRAHILGYADYDEIMTSCKKTTEYYVPEKQVKDRGLMLHFSILLSYDLAYRVLIPADPDGDKHGRVDSSDSESSNTESMPTGEESSGVHLEPDTDKIPAYILTKDFIQLLYECIMLRTITGNSWEYGMEDDLLDYEREDDDDE